MKFDKGNYIKSLPCGNQCSIEYYTDVARAHVIEYIDILLKNGYFLKDLSEPNGNIFASLIGENVLVNLSYFKHDNSLRILYDPLRETVLKGEEPTYTKITDTSLAVIPLDYSHREITDAHGMCYVITLEDGRYIIIDGGYGDYVKDETKKEPRDSKIIYNYLKKHNKRAEKITVAAWIFTHPHPDHYSAFVKFNELYKNVEIQHFIYNNGDFTTYSDKRPIDDFLQSKLPDIIKNDYPSAKIIKPHVAQKINFCNLTLTAIYTQELAIHYFAPSANNASLVLRMTVNDSSVLFMADCDCAATNLITTIYESSLNSDFMQVNHHSYSGATIELYDFVYPKYTMWNTSRAAFDLRTTGIKYQFIGNALDSNKYIYDKLGEKGCIVADGEIKHIIFRDDGYALD